MTTLMIVMGLHARVACIKYELMFYAFEIDFNISISRLKLETCLCIHCARLLVKCLPKSKCSWQSALHFSLR